MCIRFILDASDDQDDGSAGNKGYDNVIEGTLQQLCINLNSPILDSELGHESMGLYSRDDFIYQGKYISNSNSLLSCEYILGIDEQEETGGIGEVSNDTLVFSAGEELLFSRRFENGYDLPDPKYISWLRIHHPIAASVLSETSTTAGLLEGSTSTVSPVSVDPQTSPVDENSIPHHSVPLPPTDQVLTDQSCPSSTPISAEPVSIPKRSPLAELVNTPRINKDKRTKTGYARVLTSTECIRAFEEKEEQKRLAQEEKMKRKEERELKKKQKEDEMQRRKEEKARKAETREAKQREKLAMQASKQQRKQAQSSKRKATSSATSRPKKSRAAENADDEIDSNRCCTCFGLYSDDIGTEREWLKCCCGRWIHEECVDEDDVNSSATKLCPLC